MAKLTKKKAIEMSIELWQWLYENPNCIKAQWNNYIKIQNMEFDCPCCTIWFFHNGDLCPLVDEMICGLCRENEPDCAYVIWENSKYIHKRKKAAKKILDTLKKYYEDRWGKCQQAK